MIDLAFELGYPQVLTLDSKVIRMDRDQAAALEAQVRGFEEKFGRTPGPDDPLFFDPDADEPRPVSLTGLETETVAMLEAAGICPAWIYAYQHTGGLLPRPDGSFASARDQAEWDEVISRYGVKVEYLIGTMIELPRAALTADEIAKEAEFFSFGTNDLTQTVFGFSRDDINKFLPSSLQEGILKQDPFAALDREVDALQGMQLRVARVVDFHDLLRLDDAVGFIQRDGRCRLLPEYHCAAPGPNPLCGNRQAGSRPRDHAAAQPTCCTC